MDGVGINDNGLGSAGDLPALAVKAETIAPFRRGMGSDGGLVGKSAVTAAVAAVQQNLARMEKVRDRPRTLVPRDRYFASSERVASGDPVAKNENRLGEPSQNVFFLFRARASRSLTGTAVPEPKRTPFARFRSFRLFVRGLPGGRVGRRRARVPARVRGEARLGRGGGDAARARQLRQAAENRRGSRERRVCACVDARGR